MKILLESSHEADYAINSNVGVKLALWLESMIDSVRAKMETCYRSMLKSMWSIYRLFNYPTFHIHSRSRISVANNS